jgi:hypothetical protein
VWRTHRTCGVDRHSCGASCGTRGMSGFLARKPCAASPAGHRTLPPSNQREGREAGPPGRSGSRQERGSAPRGDSRRRPGDGDDGVGAPGCSRRASPSFLSSRASWCSYHREALTHPSAPHRPCRRRSGDRDSAGSPAMARVPSPERPCRGGVGGPRAADDAPPRGATRGTGPVTGTVGAEESWSVRWTSPHHLDPRAPWCSHHQGVSHNLRHRQLAGGGRGRTGTRIHTARRLAAPAR